MIRQQWLVKSALVLGFVAAVATAVTLAPADGGEPAPAPAAGAAKHSTLTWKDALAKLKTGNAHFVHDEPLPTDLSSKTRSTLAKDQHPYAVVLTCADSRVAPELLFGAGLGELFVVRVAGNVVDDDVMGSIEYAVHHLDVHLIVVLGHTGCGAVKAKIAPPKDPSEALAKLVGRVYTGGVTDVAELTTAVHANAVWQTRQLLTSPVIGHAYHQGETTQDADGSHTVHVYSGVYDLATGEATLEAYEHEPAPAGK